jgi:hypothetical protein
MQSRAEGEGEVWGRIATDNQKRMIAALEILASDDQIERQKTMIVQQALMAHALDQLHNDLMVASAKIEDATARSTSAMWSLLKVPIACVMVGAASWAFLYAHEITENTWLVIMAIAVFPWMGDSITAIAKIFGIGQGRRAGAAGSEQ